MAKFVRVKVRRLQFLKDAGKTRFRFPTIEKSLNPDRCARLCCTESLVRKGGLEPPRFYPPDPKFNSNQESIV